MDPLCFDLSQLPAAPDGKKNRHGKAAVLSDDQMAALFGKNGLKSDRDRLLFGICYFTGSRITEVLKLTVDDITPQAVMFRASTTKTKETRTAAIHPSLHILLKAYSLPTQGYLFPGRHGQGRLTRQGADLILREVCESLGLVGISTHSFRRSFVTNMRRSGKTFTQIQRYTGHKSLSVLVGYEGAL